MSDYNIQKDLGLGNQTKQSNSWKKSRWWFQIFFIFNPTWGNVPNLTSIYFSNGLVQPPTRKMMDKKSRNRPCTLSCAFVVDIAKFHVVPPWACKTFVVPNAYWLPYRFSYKNQDFCVKNGIKCLGFYLITIKLRHLLEGIFDDPKLVADVKEAVATIKKVRLNFFLDPTSTASSFSTKKMTPLTPLV